MENFIYNDTFCKDLETLMDLLDINMPSELLDDWKAEVDVCELQPLCQLDHKSILEMLYNFHEERFPEDDERTDKQVLDAIIESFDVDKFNGLVPELYYPTKSKAIITKADLVEYSS